MSAIDIEFSPRGDKLFYDLTNANCPTGNPPVYRHLAILLDERVVIAPRLLQPIGKRVQIRGSLTDAEVDQVFRLLQAGALPAPLKPMPISETNVEPNG